jgi:hypothetical protein
MYHHETGARVLERNNENSKGNSIALSNNARCSVLISVGMVL